MTNDAPRVFIGWILTTAGVMLLITGILDTTMLGVLKHIFGSKDPLPSNDAIAKGIMGVVESGKAPATGPGVQTTPGAGDPNKAKGVR